MVEVTEVFQESLQHCLAGLLSNTKLTISEFIASVILQEKPFMVLTPEGIPHVIDIVFTSSEIRDFVFNLHFTFFSRWGHSEDNVDGLINNLSRGLGLSNMARLSAMPNDISNRLITFEHATEVLKENKWIIIILLIQLCISTDLIIDRKTIKAKE